MAAALALAAVGLLRGRQNVEQVRRWMRARSVSEALKTEVFLFLTRSGTARLTVTADWKQRCSDWSTRPATCNDTPRGCRQKDRPLPAIHDVDSYLDVRVRQSQLDGYYEPKAPLLRQQLRALKAVEVTLALVAAALQRRHWRRSLRVSERGRLW